MSEGHAPTDIVTMSHPDLPGQTAQVTYKAFQAVWKDKGWKLPGTRKGRPAATDTTEENADA